MIDGLNGYSRSMPDEDYLVGHMLQLTSYLNRMGVTTILTEELPLLTGNTQLSVYGLSHMIDAVILLKYFEHRGGLHRAIGVIKNRSGDHDKDLRRLEIASQGDPRRRAAAAVPGHPAGRGRIERRSRRAGIDGIGGSVRWVMGRPALASWSSAAGVATGSCSARCSHRSGPTAAPSDAMPGTWAGSWRRTAIDLVLADSSGGLGLLGELLRALDAHPTARDLPLVLLGDASDVGLLADLTTRRFNATLLAKPVEPTQLAAAVQSALRYWAGRRENRRLMAQLEAARDEGRRRARRRYHDLVNGLGSVVWEADAATGRFTFMSERTEGVFGYPCERWIDEPGFWLERVLPDDRDYARGAWKRGLRDGRDFELEYRATTADGRTIWIREAARVSRDDQGRSLGLRGLMWNISKRKKVERQLYRAKSELAERLSELSYLHELSTRLSATLELEPTLEEVLAAVMGVLGAELGVLRLLDPDRGELCVAASAGFEAGGRLPVDPLPVGQGVCGTAEVRSEPVVVADVEAETDDRASRTPPGSRAAAPPTAPRWSPAAASRWGRSRLISASPIARRSAQVRLVELYARHAADVVEHARLHRELRDADRRKDEFLAMLAHELRNPLAAILGAAQVLGLDDAEESDVGGIAGRDPAAGPAHDPAHRRPARRLADPAAAPSPSARCRWKWERRSTRPWKPSGR